MNTTRQPLAISKRTYRIELARAPRGRDGYAGLRLPSMRPIDQLEPVGERFLRSLWQKTPAS